MSDAADSPVLYQRVADVIEQLIRSGALRAGDRLPSVRRAGEQHGVSVTTAVQAYLLLENRGLIEARPRSGFFVRGLLREKMPEPKPSRPASAVTLVSVGSLQSRLFEAAKLPGIVALGSAAPAAELLPEEKLNRALAAVSRQSGKRGVSYDWPPGAEPLRREIVKRTLDAGVSLAPDEIITTCGARRR